MPTHVASQPFHNFDVKVASIKLQFLNFVLPTHKLFVAIGQPEITHVSVKI